MSSFFEEVKRRKVYRVAIAYVIASWALAQGLAQVLPVFDVANSVTRAVIAVMLVGFPRALFVAWVSDVAPQRIKTTPTAGSPQQGQRNIAMLIAAGVGNSGGLGLFPRLGAP